MEENPLPPAYSTSTALCSICARALDITQSANVTKDYGTEKETLPIQRECCGRWVCRSCLNHNPRFATYCPHCPSSTNVLPPSYDTAIATGPSTSASFQTSLQLDTKVSPSHQAEDILHFVRPTDSVLSLSFLYKIPAPILRSYNRLFSDQLLLGRQTILISGEYYQGPSHSATPVGGEEEEARKSKLKRFQTKSKCIDVKMAEVYLDNAGWHEQKALDQWWKDEKWEQEQNRKGKGKGKGLFGTGLTGQLR